MKKLVWFVAGIALGAVAARQIEENPAARKAYEEAKLSVAEFRDAVLDGYKEREAELAKPKPRRTTSAAKKTGTKSKSSGK